MGRSSVFLTRKLLQQKVAKRTGLPENLVAQVIDAAVLEMQTELIQQGAVKLRGFATISTTIRRMGGHALEIGGSAGTKVLLTIKPVHSFRQRLNQIDVG